MKTTYDHVSLTVSDIDRSIAFYSRYFDLKVARRDQTHRGALVENMTQIKGAELNACFLTNGHLVLELLQFVKEGGERDKALPVNEIGSYHLGFSVEDVRQAYREWGAEGVVFLCEPVMSSRGDSWTTNLLDPDGIIIELRDRHALTAQMVADALA